MKLEKPAPGPRDEDETFWFGPVGWDVEKAKKLINARKVRESIPLNVEELGSQLSWVCVYEDRALAIPPEALEIPIILGCYPPLIGEEHNGKNARIVIDGHHRLWRFQHEKRETIRAFVLTLEENKQIELGDAWKRMRLQAAAAERKKAKKGAKKR